MLDSMLRTKGIDSKIDICLGLRLHGEKGKVGFPWLGTLDKDSGLYYTCSLLGF